MNGMKKNHMKMKKKTIDFFGMPVPDKGPNPPIYLESWEEFWELFGSVW